MSRTVCIAAVLLSVVCALPATAAEEEKEQPDVVTHLLVSTNQGGLQEIPMQSMKACQTAADAIYDKGDAYSGPSLYLYCVSIDGNVWAFDRWDRDN